MFQTDNSSYTPFKPEYQTHSDIDQTAYMDALKKYHKPACKVFLRMHTWNLEIC